MRFSLATLVLLFIATLSFSSLAQQDRADDSVSLAPGSSDVSCESAEACYRVALTTEDVSASREDRVRSKIERLGLVPLREPESVWAKRALLLIGLLMMETDSADAVRQLQTSQVD